MEGMFGTSIVTQAQMRVRIGVSGYRQDGRSSMTGASERCLVSALDGLFTERES
jgi:hypothetical protein